MTEVLWEPAPDARQTTQLGRFADFCEQRTGRRFADYNQLWEWSTDDGLEDCWAAIWDFYEVAADPGYDRVLDQREMPGATWFPGARLNYAAHILGQVAERADEVAIVGVSQTRERVELTWAELGDQVSRVRAWLVDAGVGRGDRVVAYLPHIPETVVAFLATASLGAIWSSCAPEFGVRAVLDRFEQIEPKVLFAIDGYRYGRKEIDRVEELAAIRAGLPSLESTVLVPYLHPVDDATSWDEVVATEPVAFDCEPVAVDHPLYVLYSSGTTGLPKAIVHGHGGILLEHLKVLGLHTDLDADDTLFWFTTTGWMMWNFVVSSLLLGARLVTFDGDPSGAGPETLWQLAADERVSVFGVGAPFLTAASRSDLVPGQRFDLSALRVIGSTGAPLPPQGFDWVYECVSPDAQLNPISGGTDVCSAFVGASPMTPVWRGEIPCSYLGCAVAAFDDHGEPVIGTQGELVIAEPMPSMPVGFWGDDGSRYRAAYFEQFPGVWRHGDWVTITERGSCVITGRSDATLNRGGVRIGTAEIYRVVESVDGVVDSLVVHLEAPDDPGTLVLFVALDDGAYLDDGLVGRIRTEVRAACSPRHVPDEVHEVPTIPTTLSGKKLELPVKKVLLGAQPDEVASRDALKNPSSLDPIAAIAEQRPGSSAPER